MKKIFFVLVSSVLLFSCGRNKKDATDTLSEVAVKDNYSIIFQGVFEKDDEVVVQYKKGGYMDYDHPVKSKIIGQPTIQSVVVNLPSGDVLENFQFFLSTNKEQKFVKLKCITITNNGKQVFIGDNLEYLKYFASNSGIIMDEINQRYNLDFSGQFPPGFTGNEQLEAILVP
jgi:hypothetical protein